MRANFVFSGVWAGIRRNLSMTVALVLSTSIALAFVGAAILANTEITRFKSDYEGRLNVSVFLCPKVLPKVDAAAPATTPCKHKVTQPEIDALRTKLEADSTVSSIKFVSEQEQYRRGKAILNKATASQLQVGVLPASFTVLLKDVKKDFPAFKQTYQTQTGVSQVANQIKTINRLLDIINGARLFSIVIALVVLIASILLISNTIQVAAAQRKNETSIMRLVGASRWMTELPFMLETVIATAIGGLIAFGMVAFGKEIVLNNIFNVQVENGVIPNLGTNDVLVASGLSLIGGVVLAALTAFATLRLYVKL